MSPKIKAVLMMASLMVAALLAGLLGSQQVGEAVRAVASAVWGA